MNPFLLWKPKMHKTYGQNQWNPLSGFSFPLPLFVIGSHVFSACTRCCFNCRTSWPKVLTNSLSSVDPEAAPLLKGILWYLCLIRFRCVFSSQVSFDQFARSPAPLLNRRLRLSPFPCQLYALHRMQMIMHARLHSIHIHINSVDVWTCVGIRDLHVYVYGCMHAYILYLRRYVTFT